MVACARQFASLVGDANRESAIWLATSTVEVPKVGQIVRGTINTKREFGIFVELDANLFGLARIVDLSDTSPVELEALPPVGANVRFVVLGVEESDDGIRVALSMKPSVLAEHMDADGRSLPPTDRTA